MTFQAPRSVRKSLFENMLDGLAYCHMIFDKQGHPVDFTYLQVNKNFEKLTGLKEVIGKRATEVIPGIRTSNPELFEIYGRVSLGGEPQRFEIYIAPLSRWFFVSVYSPQEEYFTAVFQNITSQKETERDLEDAKIAARNVLEDLQIEKEALAHAKAKDEAMLASIGDGVIIVDLDGKITFMNQSAQNMLGWTSAEVVGKPLLKVVPTEDERGSPISHQVQFTAPSAATRVPVLEEGEYVLPTTTVTSGVYYYIRKNKTKFPAVMNSSQVILDGQAVGAIEIFHDITREKEIDKAKSEFVSLASHQLRTPLGIMKWYLEALKNEAYFKKAPPVTRKYFDEIYRSNERVISLVRDLLSVARIDQGKVGEVPSLVNPVQAVKTIVEQMQIVARAKRVILHLTIRGKHIPSLSIDKLRFHEVIDNLIVNAIGYSDVQGTVDVIVKKEGNRLFISVKDTGIGISATDQKRLFTKFFRTNNAIAHNPEGSGLGLYVVKSYVEGWGGEVSVESAEGQGSTFLISIPLSA